MNAATPDHSAADAQPLPQYCSARTICHRLEISISTLRRLRRRGLFPPPAFEIPGEKEAQILRWRTSDVERYLQDIEAATAAKAKPEAA